MLARLAEPVTVGQMAERAAMSRPSFHRHFLNSTGLTPLAWLHQQRIQRVKEFLETTNLPIDDIAGQVGLGTPANLRLHFRRATTITPTQHRQLFATRTPTSA